MAVTQKLTRREKRLWAGPQSMSGPAVREAIRLPVAARLVAPLLCGVAAGTLLLVADAGGWPAGSGVVGAAALLWLCLLGLARYARARRRRLGLVQVTQPQFDLIMALSQLPPAHIVQGRALHDDLIAAIADPRNRDAEVAAIEAGMRRLVAVGTNARGGPGTTPEGRPVDPGA